MFNNRTDIRWDKLEENLRQFHYQIITAEKNGHCFIGAIRFCLERDHGLMFTETDIKKLITYEVYQNNNYYIPFYNGNILSMLRSLDRYIMKGVYTHQVVDIAVLAAANILRTNLCIYKEVNGKATLYAQQSNPPSTRDVYLKYHKEHYDSIVQNKKKASSETCITFNITQDDVAAFQQIGASFHITNPAEINGGKLYFVPPKDFCIDAFVPNTSTSPDRASDQLQRNTLSRVSATQMKRDCNNDDGTVFVRNEHTLENGVRDFQTDINTDDMHVDVTLETESEDENENEMYDMFQNLDLSKELPPEFQFEENYSGDEDGVLDNIDEENEAITPSKRTAKKMYHPTSTPKGKKKLDRNITIDLTQEEHENILDEVIIDLTPNRPISDTLSNHPQHQHGTYDSEPSTSASDSTSIFTDSSSSTSRKRPKKYEKVKLDERRMQNAPHDFVDQIPWGIDGDHIYTIKCSEDEWIKKYEDGRWFFLKDSSNVNIRGKRKIGKCLGSFTCKRGDCPKLTTEDVVNTVDFRRIDKDKDTAICSCCGFPTERDYCGCIKAVEYNRETESMTYYHQGFHICGVKPNVRECRKVIEKLPIPITAYTKPSKYMKDCMYHYIDSEDYDSAFDISKSLSQADVISEIKKLRKNPDRSLHKRDELLSFHHVNRMKDSLLKSNKDKYLIYKWECKLMGGKSSYVFKTSAVSLKIAGMMAGKIKVGGEYSSLCREPAFFDGMHKRVKYFVSLTLWVFHPAMRMMLEMAVMDTPCENSDDIEVFFSTFNAAVAEYLNEPEYIWDPFLIMMDHKGANFEALERVYGYNFRMYKTVTCQWHFLHCAEKYITKCSESERVSFRTWCKQLCKAHTQKEYLRLSKLIKGIAKKYDFLPWWKWWSPRCPHLCPAIRGFSLPSMNKAEIGQSKLKQEKPLWITEAVKVDIIDFAFQTERYNKFISNSEKIGGRGPTLKMRNERERAEERLFVDQFCDVIENGDLLGERHNPEQVTFMPSSRAKHKAPRNDIGIQEKPKKSKAPKQVTSKKLPDRSGRGFNPKFAVDAIEGTASVRQKGRKSS